MHSRLAAARDQLGWSQARLVSELERRSRTTGLVVMSTSSLKTALSRWENGHVTPDRHYRQLLRDIYGLSDTDLGFPSLTVATVEPAQAAGTADLRRDMDQLLGADAATCVTGLEERVDLQAQDCVRIAPSVMLTRLLSDFEDVKTLIKQPVGQPLAMRLYEVAADLSVLVGDELMVLGRPADSQAWYTTAKAAALRTGSSQTRARALSLNALLYLYYGTPTKAVALAQETYSLNVGGPATCLAASVEAFAQAQLGNELAARSALRHSSEVCRGQGQEDSIFGFTERRQLFYRGRALLRIGGMAEAHSAVKEVLSLYPLDVVGDPAVLRLDLAERLVTEGALVDAAELAVSVLDDLRPEHRAGLSTDAGRRVLTGVVALGRHHPAVEQLGSLTAKAS